MRITITTEAGGIYPLDVSGELTVGDLKALMEVETGMGADQMLLIHNMAPMTDLERTLESYGVQDDDIIMITQNTGPVTTSNPFSALQPGAASSPSQYRSGSPGSVPQPQASGGSSGIDWGMIQIPGTSGGGAGSSPRLQQRRRPPRDPNDPEVIRQYFLTNPSELAILQERNPALAEALLSGDLQRFREALERHHAAVRDAEAERIRMMNADPFDPEYQRRIAQDIQQKNINENMEAALEHTPESFSRVVMLYINCKVNGVPVKALVDSGARSTVMSARCAQRCNIMRLVDQRFAGIAFGVGRQKIVGRVHLGQIQIGNDFLTSSFQVLEDAAEDMLLGLDMLRKHQCCIDLKENVLRIGTTGKHALFLTEKDLQEKMEMEKQQAALGMEDEDESMAKAVAKSEEEYERGIAERTRQDTGSQSRPQDPPPASSTAATTTSRTSSTGSSPAVERMQTGPASQSVGTSPFPEAAIRRITSAGFSREEAIAELQRCGGNAEMALTALLARSIKF